MHDYFRMWTTSEVRPMRTVDATQQWGYISSASRVPFAGIVQLKSLGTTGGACTGTSRGTAPSRTGVRYIADIVGWRSSALKRDHRCNRLSCELQGTETTAPLPRIQTIPNSLGQGMGRFRYVLAQEQVALVWYRRGLLL